MSSHFDLVDFRLFANIAEASSFTAGAEKSNLSTSAASLRIRNLEDSLGGRLFHRTSQGSTLTPAGEACLQRIRNILAEFERMKSDISRHAGDDSGRLRISVSNSGVNEPLPTVMRHFMKRFPAIRLSLHVAMSHEIAPAVAAGATDIGIGGNSRASDVESLPYLHDRLVLIVPPDHVLAGAESLRFADALDHDIIGLPERSGVQMFMRRIEQNSRKPMRISVTVGSNEALKQMVETGFGIGVISERVASIYRETSTIRVIPLKDKAAASDIQICVSNLHDLPKHARAFVDLLQQHAEPPAAPVR